MGNSRGSDCFGHDEIRVEPVPRIPVRVSSQYQTGCSQFLRNHNGEIQFESVWRLTGRRNPKGQDLLLRRLSGKDAAARDSLCGPGAYRGDAKWRFLRGCIRQSAIGLSDQSQRERSCGHSLPVRWLGQSATRGARWKPAGGRRLQQDSAGCDQSHRSEDD